MASRLKRDRARQRLAFLLSISEDPDFLQMIWCVDRLRAGDFEVGARGLRNLPGDLRQKLAEHALYIQPWILEDLVNELFTVDKPKVIVPRRLNCESYVGFASAYTAALAVDDAESGFELERGRDVLQAMPRFGHRQFDWQQGWMSAPMLYRSAFIYGQGECEAWFMNQHGLTPSELVLFAMASISVYSNTPYGKPENFLVPQLNLDGRIINAALALMSAPLKDVRDEAIRSRRGSLNVAARPSVLRRTPMVNIGDRGIMAPLPELVLERATAGLYLDLVKAPSGMRDYIGRRFEQYSLELFEAAFGDKARGEYVYGSKSAPLKTPDILVGETNQLKLIVECKATRMSFAVRFSDDWHQETTRGYGELAKGVGQIWRHCSHMRRGLVPDRPSTDLVGLLLTLDPWMRMTHKQDEVILELARDWCANSDPEITAEDECSISFTHVGDIEALLHRTTSEGVLTVLGSAARKVGWGTNELGYEEKVEELGRPYFFKDRVSEVLPWYDRLGDGGAAGSLGSV
tara:strand:- start:309 stop:1862 length:1554 start_codon:yes stop_codon:yes gene_type:complete